jgi:hypothetical protein
MSFTPDSFTPESSASEKPFARPEALLRVPVGLASPLWGLFAGAAMSGAAWWWMTRWARPENLEAMFGAAAKFEAAVEPKVVELAAPVLAAVEAAPETALETEAAVETVTEAVVEAAQEPVPQEPVFQAPVLEARVEVPAAPQAVGGEAAPVFPVLEALEPKIVAEPAATLPKPKKTPASKPA